MLGPFSSVEDLSGTTLKSEFLSFCLTMWHAGSQFPNQGSKTLKLYISKYVEHAPQNAHLFINHINVLRSVCVLVKLFCSWLFLAMRCGMHAGSQFLDQGLNPCPLHWEYGVLTTGLPGKSRFFVFKIKIFSSHVPMDLLIHQLGYEYCNLETSSIGVLVSII